MTLLTLENVADTAVKTCKRTSTTLRAHFAGLVDCRFINDDQARDVATILVKRGYDLDARGAELLPAIDADALTLDDAGVVDCKP
jgi:hypothetical protein